MQFSDKTIKVRRGVSNLRKLFDECLYSLDKLIIEFPMCRDNMQELMNKYACRLNFSQWESKKLSTCRYNYRIELSNGESFHIGFCPNWLRQGDKVIKFGRIEFNPNKVAEELEFISLYHELFSTVPIPLRKPLRFDLAIDMPIAREKVYMCKDQRTYEEYSNSVSDRTQYLGQRNSHGRVKVYNKALEQKLPIELTRLELTIDYDKRSIDEVKHIIPKLYLLDNFQFPIGMKGTDKVIMVAVLGDPSLLKELGRDKAKKIEAYLADMLLHLPLDTLKYNKVLDSIQDLINAI